MRSQYPRHLKSWRYANIILNYDLFNEWRMFCYKHPKIKSKVRSAAMFLNHKKMIYVGFDKFYSVNMDTLEDFYFE